MYVHQPSGNFFYSPSQRPVLNSDVHSSLPGDLHFPLLPVPWIGDDALDSTKVQNRLAASQELKRSLETAPKSYKRAKAQDFNSVVRIATQDDVPAIMDVERSAFSSPYEESAFRFGCRLCCCSCSCFFIPSFGVCSFFLLLPFFVALAETCSKDGTAFYSYANSWRRGCCASQRFDLPDT